MVWPTVNSCVCLTVDPTVSPARIAEAEPIDMTCRLGCVGWGQKELYFRWGPATPTKRDTSGMPRHARSQYSQPLSQVERERCGLRLQFTLSACSLRHSAVAPPNSARMKFNTAAKPHLFLYPTVPTRAKIVPGLKLPNGDINSTTCTA